MSDPCKTPGCINGWIRRPGEDCYEAQCLVIPGLCEECENQ